MNLFLLATFLVAGPYLRIDIAFTGEVAGLLGPRHATWINPNFPPLLGGAASLKTFLDEARAKARQEADTFFLFDAGGVMGGDLMGEGSDPQRPIRIMNRLGYDAMNVGLRDLFLGWNGLQTMIRTATFPLISSNIRLREDTTQTPPGLHRALMLDVQGIRIGVMGLITENAVLYLWKRNQRGLFFKRDIQTAQEMVDSLRREGADLIWVLSNMGFQRDTMLARRVPGIDLIIGSFDGFGLREAYEDPQTHTIVVRTYNGLSEVGWLSLYVSPKTRQVVGYNYRTETLFVDRYEPDPDILEMVAPQDPDP